MNENYSNDLYMSIGINCRPASNLRSHFLRYMSCPLDWMLGCSLENVIHLFETKFTDFFNEIYEDVEMNAPANNRWVVDTYNNIVSMHHFPKSLTLSDGHKDFKQKMNMRFDRLDNEIRLSKTMVLLSYGFEPVDELKKFLKKFHALYPNLLSLRLINIKNDKTMSAAEVKHEIFNDGSCSVLECWQFNDFYERSADEKRTTNYEMWERVLGNYKCPKCIQSVNDMLSGKKIVVYGAGGGQLCKQFLKFSKNLRSCEIQGVAVTDLEYSLHEIEGYQVRNISAYDKKSLVLISISDKTAALEVAKSLYELGYENQITPNEMLGVK